MTGWGAAECVDNVSPFLFILICGCFLTDFLFLQGNQEHLFREIVQFSPNELQSGGGSGLGLWSK